MVNCQCGESGRTLRQIAALVACLSLAIGDWTLAIASPSSTIAVELSLFSGGRISGAVVDHNDDAVVIVADRKPFVFAWNEIRPQSAFVARRALLTHARGGADALTAEDRFALGLFALQNDLVSTAQMEFAAAIRLDGAIAPRVAEARDARREAASRRQADRGGEALPAGEADDVAAEAEREPSADAATGDREIPLDDLVGRNLAAAPGITVPPEVRRQVREIYDRFAATVIERMGAGTTLLETDHFLIYSDLPGPMRQRVGEWAEAMYAALHREFGFAAEGDVFLAKCPLFCWKSMARFQRFARVFDGQDGRNAVGYTRSIERNGHVHIVLFLSGRTEAEYDAFVATLVHEGAHAFVHRLGSTRLIPHWVNEGLAEWTAESVLGDRCPAGEKADLLAAQYVRFNWPIGHFLRDVGPIAVHDYPLAMSVVSHLIAVDRDRWRRFVALLKEGRVLPDALAEAYDGLDLAGLEAAWRTWVAARLSLPPANDGPTGFGNE
jgi:hypothetical protein